MGFILMKHPDIDGIGEASEEAFETNYKFKGWVRVEDEPVVASGSMVQTLRAEAEAANAKSEVVQPESATNSEEGK